MMMVLVSGEVWLSLEKSTKGWEEGKKGRGRGGEPYQDGCL